MNHHDNVSNKKGPSVKSLNRGRPQYRMCSCQSTLDSAVKQSKTKSKQFSKQPITQWIGNYTCGIVTFPCLDIFMALLMMVGEGDGGVCKVLLSFTTTLMPSQLVIPRAKPGQRGMRDYILAAEHCWNERVSMEQFDLNTGGLKREYMR